MDNKQPAHLLQGNRGGAVKLNTYKTGNIRWT